MECGKDARRISPHVPARIRSGRAQGFRLSALSHSVAAAQVSSANTPKSNTRVHQSPGTRPQRNPGKVPDSLPLRCRKMRQHRQRYFRAMHRRPSLTINGTTRHAQEYASRNLGPGRTGTPGDPRARSAAAARSRTGRRELAVRQGSLRAPAVRGRRHGLTAALRGSRSTRRDRPGSGTHHTAPCCGRRCAAMLAAIAPAHLAQTLRQRLRGPSARRPLEAPAHSAVSCPATHGWYDMSPEQTGTTERPATESWNLHPVPALPVRPSSAIRLLARRAGRGTLRLVIPLEKRNAVSRGQPLKTSGGVNPAGRWCALSAAAGWPAEPGCLRT